MSKNEYRRSKDMAGLCDLEGLLGLRVAQQRSQADVWRERLREASNLVLPLRVTKQWGEGRGEVSC
jgi:hypothetical protein